jgi:putative exporter of polyketide antibiotics
MNWLGRIYCATRITWIGSGSETLAIVSILWSIIFSTVGADALIKRLFYDKEYTLLISSGFVVMLFLILTMLVAAVVVLVVRPDWDKCILSSFDKMTPSQKSKSVLVSYLFHSLGFVILFILVMVVTIQNIG